MANKYNLDTKTILIISVIIISLNVMTLLRPSRNYDFENAGLAFTAFWIIDVILIQLYYKLKRTSVTECLAELIIPTVSSLVFLLFASKFTNFYLFGFYTSALTIIIPRLYRLVTKRRNP